MAHNSELRKLLVAAGRVREIRDSHMAEEYVVKEQLDQEMIEGGVQLTLKLDEIVTGALWFLVQTAGFTSVWAKSRPLKSSGSSRNFASAYAKRSPKLSRAEYLPFPY
jgi:hypothetical protein